MRDLRCGGRGGRSGGLQRGTAHGQCLVFACKAIELGAQQVDTLRSLGGALTLGGQGGFELADGLQPGFGILLPGAERTPGLFGLVGRVLAPQHGKPIDARAVTRDLGIEAGQFRGERGLTVERLLVGAARAAIDPGEQFIALHFHVGEQFVTAAGGHFAERGIERAAQVIGGVADRLVHLLRRALLDPQQAGNAPVLGAARPAPGMLVAEQFGEAVLGVLAVERLTTDPQHAALAGEKGLGEPARLAVEFEVEFHAGRRTRFAPGTQVVHAGGAVTLEEGRADGRDDRALAGLVGAGEQVQARGQRVDFQRCAELAELLDADAGELHRTPSPAGGRRAVSNPASRASASRAVSAWAASPTCCTACRAPTTSAR